MSKILLVPDAHGWAFFHWATGIQQHAPAGYDVTVAVQQELQDHKEDVEWLRRWDAICHFAWIDCPFLFGIRRLVTVVAHDGLKWHHVRDEAGRACMLEMRQWAASSPQRNLTNAQKILPRADSVIAVNDDLHGFVTDKIGCQRCRYIPAGVDHQYYVPRTPVWPAGSKLRLGWCGQPGGRTKGYEWILEPLMESFGDSVEFVVNRHSHLDALSPAEMVDWYNSIDLFLCTSISEGSPMPPFEAMSCGRGVISTPAGEMPRAIGDSGGAGILVPGYTNEETRVRTIEHFVKEIESLTPDMVRLMGRQARQRIQEKYTWQKLAPKWLKAIAG